MARKSTAQIWMPLAASVVSTRDAECHAYVGTDGAWIARRGTGFCHEHNEHDGDAPYSMLAELCEIDAKVLAEWRKRGVDLEGTDAASKT
jgi:hypothetical protein